MKPLQRVAIVGRPNVGKSTLFNRILGRRQAIVGQQSGLTRDRHHGTADWTGHYFEITDTGGLEWDSADELLSEIQSQAFSAVADADLIVFVVDGKQGLAPIEAQIGAELRRSGAPVLLVVNKCDSLRDAETTASEFHTLGLEPVFAVSAEHGFGVADMLDEVVRCLPESAEEPDELPDGTIRVAVVGRPNVGKSSLVNALLGTERVVVSDVSGTTRDAIDIMLERSGRHYMLVDTAGIRRGGRREGFAEMVSVLIARRRIQKADVALLVVDASIGLSRQDVTIAAEAGEAGCGLIVVVNKWDLVDTERNAPNDWVEELKDRMGRIGFATFAFVSAKTGDGLGTLLPLVDRTQDNRLQRVPTAQLNALFDRIERHGPQGPPGAPQLKYVTQVGVGPPTFVLFVRGRGTLPPSYQRYIENQVRARFDLSGTPVRIRVRVGKSEKAPSR